MGIKIKLTSSDGKRNFVLNDSTIIIGRENVCNFFAYIRDYSGYLWLDNYQFKLDTSSRSFPRSPNEVWETFKSEKLSLIINQVYFDNLEALAAWCEFFGIEAESEDGSPLVIKSCLPRTEAVPQELTRREQFKALAAPLLPAAEVILEEVARVFGDGIFNILNLEDLEIYCGDLRKSGETFSAEVQAALELVEEFLK